MKTKPPPAHCVPQIEKINLVTQITFPLPC